MTEEERFMYRIRSVRIVLSVLLVLILNLPAAAQSLDEVLAVVSSHVNEFEDLLPDFVCNERIISTEFDSGRVLKEKVVDSIFTGVQRSSEQNRVRFAFTESREVLAINGKQMPKGTLFPKLPYRFTGGYSSFLITTFAPENLQYHDYTIADTYKSGGSESLLVRFTTKEDQQTLRTMFQGTQLVAKDVGAAWIDLNSFEVLRLQRQSLNLPPGFIKSTATVDYAPVTIGEIQFWMPARIRAEVTERNSRAVVSYVAEYSDCRRFTADIKILQ